MQKPSLKGAGIKYLVLQHGKNPDIAGGYWDEPIDPAKLVVPVADLKGARKVFCEWRDKNRLGGGNLTVRCGLVYEDFPKNVIGQFSFNGRFWDTTDCTKDRKEVLI